MEKNNSNYIAQYEKEKCTQIKMKLNNVYDADILEHLGSKENKQGYLKNLIREDIMTNVEKERDPADEEWKELTFSVWMYGKQAAWVVLHWASGDEIDEDSEYFTVETEYDAKEFDTHREAVRYLKEKGFRKVMPKTVRRRDLAEKR